ncbi:MAG: hypothetical protein AB1568_09410 [Thermodesulfobacteriota bacterium]
MTQPAIIVEETHGQPRHMEPVRLGIPLPRGFVADCLHLRLTDEARQTVPVQTRPLALWPDRSCKWVLLDFPVSVPANGKAVFFLQSSGESAPASSPSGDTSHPRLAITRNAATLEVDTGTCRFTLDLEHLPFCASILVGGREYLHPEGIHLSLSGQDGRIVPATIESAVLEEEGPLRCAVLYQGTFRQDSSREVAARFRLRLHFFAGASLMLADCILHNPRPALHSGGLWDLGDPGSFFFRDCSLRLRLNGEVRSLHWQPLPGEGFTTTQDIPWCLHQDSSGGENWDSPNHVDKDGNPTVTFQGYRVLGGGTAVLARGKRATPLVRCLTDHGPLSFGMPHFWQNFPKALRVERQGINIGLFPEESLQSFELQGGEQKRHTIFLDFGPETAASGFSPVLQPLHAAPNPEWVAASGAVSCLVPHEDDPNEHYLDYVGSVIAGDRSFFARRESIDEYGWRNFGDIYADHEAVNHPGPGIFVSHYNNQYDFISGGAFHFLRTGDRRWFELAADLARHVIDIDIYHTDRDKPAYNHGLFWHTDHYKPAQTCTHRGYSAKNAPPGGGYGGGTSNEHNYTTGLLLYHYLTGDEEARQAVLELADYVLGMDDGSQTIFGIVDSGPTGIASQTVSTDFHKPGRGAGNSINALMDGWRLTGDRGYMRKAEELIQRCIHPRDSITALRLDDPEYRWSYLVFLQVLGKFLDLKTELGEADYIFHYARESFLHYADWMTKHETPYKDVLHKVDIPTETWPAHDVRKCCILLYAAKYGPAEREDTYRQKALFFFERCLTDLLSFETSHLARPRILLAVYGWMVAYFQKHPALAIKWQPHLHRFGEPDEFIPQRARFRGTLARQGKIAFREAVRLLRCRFPNLRKRP